MSAQALLDEVRSYTDDLIAVMTPEERNEFDRLCDRAAAELARENEDNYEQWLQLLFPEYFRVEFAAHQRQGWEWVWSIELDEKPEQVLVEVWARGAAKSTSAEGACVAWGARQRRRFGLYVCETQAQADDHVANIGTMLESRFLEMAYPELGQRAVGKFGQVKGWRRNRLRTESGLTIDALGLDTAARGIKIDADRPDFMVFDDIDNENDGPGQTEKKIEAITNKLLPAGSSSLAVLVIQNLPNANGVVARLAGVSEEPADFLQPRIVIGPIPAVEDLTVDERDGRWMIVDGRPTWPAGQSLETCQTQIDQWGITAFRIEAQHETEARGGGVFDHLNYLHCKLEEVPWDQLSRVAVACDPAVTDKDKSDSHGVHCDALADDGTIYRLRSWEQRADPVTAIKVAVAFAIRFGTRAVIVESDQGGDTWKSVYREAVEIVRADVETVKNGGELNGPAIYVQTVHEIVTSDLVFPLLHSPQQEKAGSAQTSKAGRAQQMLAVYESARKVVHVLGTHLVLERGLNRFGKTKPFDLTDAAYWSMRDLLKFGQKTRTSSRRGAARSLPQPSLGSRA